MVPQGWEDLPGVLLDHVQAAVIATDLTGVIVHWNSFAEILYGWSREEALGRNVVDLTIGPQDPEVASDIMRRLGEGETWHGELPVRRKDGSAILAYLTDAPLYDSNGTLVGVVGVSVDVTERTLAGRRLAAQYEITKILAASASLAEATPAILRAMCECLEWELGGLWEVERRAGRLRCVDIWSQTGRATEESEFVQLTRRTSFAPGIGLPGRVWSSTTPTWIPDVVEDENFPRAIAALESGFHAGAGFPIVLGGEVLGVMEFFSREIHEPDQALLDMMAAVGSEIGQFIERKQAEDAVAASEALQRAILESAIDGIVGMDAEGLITEFNPAAVRMFGHSAEDVLGRPMADIIIPPSHRERHRSAFKRYLDTGEATILGHRIEMPALRADGSEFPVELTVIRVGVPGSPMFTAYLREISDRVRADTERARLLESERSARAAAEAAERRQTFLAQASEMLDSSLVYEATLKNVANMAVPRLADWCSVEIVEDDGSLRQVAVAHVDAARVRLASELRRRYPPDPDAPFGPSRVLRTGLPELYEEITEEILQAAAAAAGDAELLRILRELGLRSAMVVPMIARGSTLGVITFVAAESGVRYGEQDIALAMDLARRAALAVSNARLLRATQEAVLRKDESLALLDTLMGTAPVGMAFWDSQLRYARVNQALADIDGMPLAEHIGKTAREVLPDMADTIEPLFRQVMETGEPVVDLVLTGETPASPGETRHWLDSFYPVRAPAGDILGVGAVVVDITERRRTLDELRARAMQQAAVAELSQRGLKGAGLEQLTEQAVSMVRGTLDVAIGIVEALEPDGESLKVTAAVGADREIVGLRVPAGRGSMAGHVLASTEPVIAEDVPSETRFDASLMADLGVVSGMAVSILGLESPFGVLIAAGTTPRRFTDDDIHFLQSVANVLAAALQRARAEEALRESEERLRLALETGPLGTWDWNLDAGTLTWSSSLEAVFGLAEGAFGGTYDDFLGFLHPEDRDEVRTAIGVAVDEGSAFELEFRVVSADGRLLWIFSVGQVLSDQTGRPVRVLGAALDVTDRRMAEEERMRLLELESAARTEAEAAQRRLAFLAEASSMLATSLEYPEILEKLGRLIVPAMADMCMIDLLEDGQLTRKVALHADPGKLHLVRELQERYPPYDPKGVHPVTQAIRSGRSLFSPEIPEELIASITRDENHRRLVRELGFESYMCVPLIASGRILGTITFVSSNPAQRYSADDLALADDLSGRAALAVENARLFKEYRHIARTLQRSLLPPELPEIPDTEIVGRYRAAGEGVEVGGDFYDVFETGQGGWALVIGDVCGKGPDAAGVTGLARYTLRAAAMQELKPSRNLMVLNEALLQRGRDQGFCTVCYVRYRESTTGARLTVSCAGHPLPIVLRKDGSVEQVGAPGTLLGIFPDPDLADEAVDLAPGDSIVLYTDGVVEEPRDARLFGTDRLIDVIRSNTGQDAETIASEIERAVVEFIQGEPRDDIALLVLRMRP